MKTIEKRLEEINENIIKEFEEWRLLKGYTKKEVAEMIGMNRKYYINISNGQSKLSGKNRRKLVEVAGLK